MSDKPAPSSAEANLTATGPFLYWLAVGLVVIGLLNSIPGIPGFDQGLRDLTGQDWFKLRKFTREWFFPMVLALMMLIVALKHSMFLEGQVGTVATVRAVHGCGADRRRLRHLPDLCRRD